MQRAARIAGYVGLAGFVAIMLIGHFFGGEGGAVAFFLVLALFVLSCVCVVVGLVGRAMTFIQSGKSDESGR
jgi:hypothetical protein